MSVTVALATDIASSAVTLMPGVGCDPPLGSKTRTTASQNVTRNRKRMNHALKSPRLLIAAMGRTLAASLETRVRASPLFLYRFEENEPRVFRKFESSAFASNLKQLREAADRQGEKRPRRRRRGAAGGGAPPSPATHPFPFRAEAPAPPPRS